MTSAGDTRLAWISAQLGAVVIGETQDIGMGVNRNGWWLERLINF